MKRLLPFLLLLVASPALACDHFVRAYNTSTTVDFCLWETDGTDFKTDATITAGEVKVSQSEGAEANCTTGTGACVTDEGSCYSLALDAAELDTARVYVTIIDTAAKTFLDKCIVIDTFGNASAQFPTADVNVTSMTGIGTGAELSALPSTSAPTFEQMIRWLYQYGTGRYKTETTVTEKTLRKDNGSTALGTCTTTDDGTTYTRGECS